MVFDLAITVDDVTKIEHIRQMTRGSQILYVPMHAAEDPAHPDCQRGFVTSYNEKTNTVFCRYWRDDSIGELLRTTLNSEGADLRLLVLYDSCPQRIIKQTMAEMEVSVV